MPNVLKNVLFPAIFEPVIISTVGLILTLKLFDTLVSATINGWPISLAFSSNEVFILGKTQSGWL